MSLWSALRTSRLRPLSAGRCAKLGLVLPPAAPAAALWQAVDLADPGGIDSIWVTDRTLAGTPWYEARAAMPGAGKYDIRQRSAAQDDGLTGQDRDLLGEQVLDIYLNDYARWREMPGAPSLPSCREALPLQ